MASLRRSSRTRLLAASGSPQPLTQTFHPARPTRKAPANDVGGKPAVKLEDTNVADRQAYQSEMIHNVGDVSFGPGRGGKRKRPSSSVEIEAQEKPELTLRQELDGVVLSEIRTPTKRVKTVKAETPATPSSSNTATTKKTPSSSKKYGLTPGVTPFPDLIHPTPEECQHVSDLLSELHGRPSAPAVIPAPSLNIAGCGEVPSVLDALIRTLLSAATNLQNSSRAFKKIVEKYGLLEEGVGKGSVDWDNVRRGTKEELFEAIQCGGLAAMKSKNIKAILDLVYEENMERRAALVKAEEEGDEEKAPAGAKDETEEERKLEVDKADQHVLSLDHLHAFSTEDAMEKLTSYPGIGVKTASCTLLFCMSRPSFAVDTHVWRLCKWLGWTPPYANRDNTYKHCDVRIPDGLKYELHALFWKHGRYCPKCSLIPQKAMTAMPDISKKECPLEALIKANGGRGVGSGRSAVKPKAGKGSRKLASGKKAGKRQKESDDESEAEMSDLTEESDED